MTTHASHRAARDAAEILAEPERFADHPSLLILARLVAMTAQGTPARQSSPTPFLAVVQS